MKEKIINVLYVIAIVALLGFLYLVVDAGTKKQAYEDSLELQIQDHKVLENTYHSIYRDSVDKKYEKLTSLDNDVLVLKTLRGYHMNMLLLHPDKNAMEFARNSVKEIDWEIGQKEKEYARVMQYDPAKTDAYFKRERERHKIDSLELLKKQSKEKFSII